MSEYSNPEFATYDEHSVAYEVLFDCALDAAKRQFDNAQYKDASLKNAQVREKNNFDTVKHLLNYIVGIVEANDIEKSDEVLNIFYDYGVDAPSNWKIDVSDALSAIESLIGEIEEVQYTLNNAHETLDEIYGQLDDYANYGGDEPEFDRIIERYDDVYSDVHDYIDSYSVDSSISINY